MEKKGSKILIEHTLQANETLLCRRVSMMCSFFAIPIHNKHQNVYNVNFTIEFICVDLNTSHSNAFLRLFCMHIVTVFECKKQIVVVSHFVHCIEGDFKFELKSECEFENRLPKNGYCEVNACSMFMQVFKLCGSQCETSHF